MTDTIDLPLRGDGAKPTSVKSSHDAMMSIKLQEDVFPMPPDEKPECDTKETNFNHGRSITPDINIIDPDEHPLSDHIPNKSRNPTSGPTASILDVVDTKLDIEDIEVDGEIEDNLNEMIKKLRDNRDRRGSRRRRTARKRQLSVNSSLDDGGALSARTDTAEAAPDDNAEDAEGKLVETINLQKNVMAHLNAQPWPMMKKLKTLKLAKSYVERYEGKLSKGQSYKQKWEKFLWRSKRAYEELVVTVTPWEMRIKAIESHFGTMVASYFTFIRALLWSNIVLTAITVGFIILPECLVGDSSGHKTVPADERDRALTLASLWDFEGYLKYSPLFYGYYGNATFIGNGYRLPLAYLLAGLGTYAYNFVSLLRTMAKNAKMNKLSGKEESYTFSWKLFTSWDYTIGDNEAATNKRAAITTTFKEAIVEEEEKRREENIHLTRFLRVLANILVLMVLASSTFAIQIVVQNSRQTEKDLRDGIDVGWWRQNEVSTVIALITLIYPSIFDFIGMMEKYHPRVQLRWQLARILVLYLLNLYTLFISLYEKVRFLQDQDKLARAAALNTSLSNCTVLPSLSNSTVAYDNTTSVLSGAINCTSSVVDVPEFCWETLVGQEMFKLTIMDLVTTVGGILVIDFLRGLFTRYMHPCWPCWDLETKFPEYGEFKIAENILHLINNQGMIWMGLFFAPGLPALNILKLILMLYIRSWAVTMCNIPHERIFRASRSNNFYYLMLLVMLFLCTLIPMIAIVMLEPSSDCGPFAGQDLMYYVLTTFISDTWPLLDDIITFVLSPAIMFPFILLLIMIIYYLISLTGSYKEANEDLRTQLHSERTEEKRKIYAMVDGQKNGASAEQKTGNSDGKGSPSNSSDGFQKQPKLMRLPEMTAKQAVSLECQGFKVLSPKDAKSLLMAEH
ncbi:unnamed protein product [Owenia fusiformis]|uniref:Uncharacterized protein n=1 Tax=Owenia fusiformis TaxID=6347 RepID=A0A8J1UCB6_OWEFU|nr:unnamed protein product [Owenia fusiformis]